MPCFEIVLHEPEIAPNTGNIMRLSVNTGSRLHLVHPLGFDMDDARVRRAGLDYRERAAVTHHDSFDAVVGELRDRRIFAFSQHAHTVYDRIRYEPGDVLVFGKESVGLPDEVLQHGAVTGAVRIPIAPGGRSLNLANAVAIAVYEAWRQCGFSVDGGRQ